jgi:predicted small metal-binding protein
MVVVVVECPHCGELEQAPDKDELIGCLARHLQEVHGRDAAEDEAADCVGKRAYEATDS